MTDTQTDSVYTLVQTLVTQSFQPELMLKRLLFFYSHEVMSDI